MKEISVTETTMNREEYEQRHSRTWDYVARASKIWEGIAEEQQAIVDGEGYRHHGYSSHEEYWNAEFADKTGWGYRRIRQMMQSRLIKLSTPIEGAFRGETLGAEGWRELGRIEDPNQRSEFLEKYEQEIKPMLRDEGVSERIFREGIKEFKGEREPVVRDFLTPEDMEDIPSGEFDDFENWASRTSKLVGPIHRMAPEEVADACERLYPEKIERHIAWADEIAQWYTAYRDELVARQRQGIRAVK